MTTTKIKFVQLEDSPQDGLQYARQSGSWTVVSGTGAGSLPEAPYDGYTYGRNSGTWTQISGTSTSTAVQNRSWFGV